MSLLTALFSLSLILYALVLAFFFLGLFSELIGKNTLKPFVSVVIPAKNEKECIETILNDLTKQTYSRDRYEIIVVDDESTDVTPNLVNALSQNNPNIYLYSTSHVSSNLKYKKRPLDLGIKKSKGEIILLTDADCRVPETWIESMVSYFEPNIGMVIGFSATSPFSTILHKIESLDFLMLLTASRGTTTQGIPFACSGQNLAYRKKAFEEVGGFSSFADALGGDDNLLLQQIKHKSKWEIVFACDQGSFVSSPPQPNFRAFFTQRARWASDVLHVKNIDPLFFGIIVTTFLVNLTPLAMILNLLWAPHLLPPLLKGLALKFLFEGTIMLRGTQIFRKKELREIFPLWFLFQIPYVVAMGVMSIFGKNLSWGGRHQ